MSGTVIGALKRTRKSPLVESAAPYIAVGFQWRCLGWGQCGNLRPEDVNLWGDGMCACRFCDGLVVGRVKMGELAQQ